MNQGNHNGLGLVETPNISLTFIDGLKEWASPLTAVQIIPLTFENQNRQAALDNLGYTLGVFTPLLAIVGLLLVPKGGSGRRY